MMTLCFLSIVRVDIPLNCQSCKPQLSELPKTWKTLCFPSIVCVDSRSFRSYNRKTKTICFLSTAWVDSSHFKSYLRKMKILCFPSTVRVDNRYFQSYLQKIRSGYSSVLNFCSYCFCCESCKAFWKHLD